MNNNENEVNNISPINKIEVDKQIKNIPNRNYHYRGMIIFFIVAIGLNTLIGYQQNILGSKTFIIGMIAICIILTAIFMLISFVIRKIGGKFGPKWSILSWILIIILPFGILGFLSLNTNGLLSNEKEFYKKDFYQPIPQDWKTYINKTFDLSLKYPSDMKLSEVSKSFGFDDVFLVSLEKEISSTTAINISIHSTTDDNKCKDLLSNVSMVQRPPYVNNKKINNIEYLINSSQALVANGEAMQIFGYYKKSHICKVIDVSYISPMDLSADTLKSFSGNDIYGMRQALNQAAKKALSKNDYTQLLKTSESIIGSMSTDIKDTDSSDIIRMNESESAIKNRLSDALTEVDGARLAAFRVYNYNPDNSKKSVNSYLGTCKDSTFRSINPDMICREGSDAFIMYFKIDNKYGFSCGDAVSQASIVTTEPIGLYCKNSTSSPTTIKSGVPVGNKFSHIGISSSYNGKNCGILEYKNDTNRSNAIAASSCFNEAISSCKPAIISGVVDGEIATYQINGNVSNECSLSQSFFKKVTSSEVQGASEKCTINAKVGWPSLSNCTNIPNFLNQFLPHSNQ